MSVKPMAAALWVALLASGALAQSIPGSITTVPQPTTGATVFDAAGNAYITGSSGPVTAGAAQTAAGGGTCLFSNGFFDFPGPCMDAHVTKVDPNGNTIFGTLLGGDENDSGTALALDSAGNIFVTGYTGGSFPATAGVAITASTAAQSFAAKLSPDGSRWLYATYLPDADTTATAIAIDGAGNAYLAGNSSGYHAFVAKLSANGSSFVYNVTLSGSGQDAITAIRVDAAGNATVAGHTTSPDFPVTAGALQSRLAGTQNVFLARLDPTGKLLYATYLGGSGTDLPSALATDSAGNLYVAGSTNSPDFPTTSGTLQPSAMTPLWNAQGSGGFLAKLTPDGHALAYSTYVISASYQAPQSGVAALAVTASGDAYIAGLTGAGFPVTPSAPQICFAGPTNLFVAHLDTHGALADATYLGQSPQVAMGLAAAADGSILLAALAVFRIRFGAGGWTAPACLSPTLLNAATLYGSGAVTAGEVVTLTGFGIGPETGVTYPPDAQGNAPTGLAGVQVIFDGQPAPVLYAQSRQVNAIAPSTLSLQADTLVELAYNGFAIGTASAIVQFGSPGIFRLQPGVSSQAAALNQDGTVNSASNPAARGSVVTLWGTGFGPTDPACRSGGLNVPEAAPLADNLLATFFDGQVNPNVVFLPSVYAGSAPSLLCGVEQVNFMVPPNAATGNYQILPVSQMATPNGYPTIMGNVPVTIAVH